MSKFFPRPDLSLLKTFEAFPSRSPSSAKNGLDVMRRREVSDVSCTHVAQWRMWL
jgi:hypothetical protein